MFLCGSGPVRRFKFPIIGHGLGPGGRLSLGRVRWRKRVITATVASKRAAKVESSILTVVRVICVEAVIQAEEVVSLFIGHTFCIVGICALGN